MSDTRIGVDFYATTASAVSEIGNLTAAVTETTTAATVAGSAQQQLGKDVAVTAAKVRESKEAAQQAKLAFETHNATVVAFGVNSTQAAASAQKLAAAEREAQKAASAAAEALAKTAKEVQAVATAEDGQLSPATKRAAAQVARLGETAERTAHDLNKMELQQKRGSAGFDVMGMASSKLMSVLGPAALGGTLIALAGWIGDSAERTLQYETAVANLPFALDGARKATRGLVSEQMLVSSAASATSLKVTRTAADFEQLAGASVKLAQKLGQPADQLLNNLVTALGRGSTELLDNAGVVLKTSEAQERYAASIGVSVSALTDEQKASAFKIEAMKAIIKAADETTVAYDSNAASVVRLKVKVGDAWDSMSRAAANGVGSIFSVVESANSAIGDMNRSLLETALAMDTTWSPAFKTGVSDTAAWAVELLGAKDTIDGIAVGLTDPANLAAMQAANDQERAKRDLLSEEADFSERMAKAVAAAEVANTAFLDAQAAAAVVYGPAAPEKAKRKAGAKKNPGEMLDPGDVAIARTFDGVEQTELVSRAAPEAAAEERAAAEQERFDAETLRWQREQEMLVERVGLEEETEAQRAALQDQQFAREQEHARWQAENARTQIARDQALTRAEEVEHRKRVLAATREAAEERKLAEQRQATFEHIGGAASDLSKSIVAAAWEQAAGQKGAIAMMLGDRLKGISIDATVTAAWETAQGVAAAAGVYTAALAPGHFAAAAESAAVAVLAGAAGVSLGAAANSAGGSSGGRPASAASGGPVTGGTNSSRGTSTAMGEQRLERQEVPISYQDEPAASIVINIGTFVGSKDSARGLAAEVSKALTRHKAQGARP